MKVVLFGAKGMVGSNILKEAVSRHHEVTIVVRNAADYTAPEGVKVVEGDATDARQVAEVVNGTDAVISAVGPGRNLSQPNPQIIPQVTSSLIKGLSEAGVKRLLLVGGAGTLEVAPGLQLVDSDNFPADYKPEALAGRESYNIIKETGSDLDWTFFCPSIIIEPGERTATFRVGNDQVLFDAQGQSRISSEDFAIAIIDELENKQNIQRKITVGY